VSITGESVIFQGRVREAKEVFDYRGKDKTSIAMGDFMKVNP
jgi:hypothetical protein